MKVRNTLAPQTAKRPAEFSDFINDEKVKKGLVDQLGGDVQFAARLISVIITTVNASEKLRECDYGSIVNAALHGEVGMNLSLALGEYSIVPYGRVAKYQPMVRGLERLCIRSKAYSNIGCFDVREGEFCGRDPKTRDPIFRWIEDEDERIERPIVGYYAFYVLNDANNNFFRCLYWSHEKILKHADRYAPAFNLDTYRKLLAGELDPKEVEKLRGTRDKKGSSPWYADPNDDPHIKMCQKTVLKQLLNDGLAPKSIQEAIAEDNYAETHKDVVIHDTDMFLVSDDTREVIEGTAEVVEDADKPKDEAATDPRADKLDSSAPVVNGATPEEMREMSDADFTAGFFW